METNREGHERLASEYRKLIDRIEDGEDDDREALLMVPLTAGLGRRRDAHGSALRAALQERAEETAEGKPGGGNEESDCRSALRTAAEMLTGAEIALEGAACGDAEAGNLPASVVLEAARVEVALAQRHVERLLRMGEGD